MRRMRRRLSRSCSRIRGRSRTASAGGLARLLGLAIADSTGAAFRASRSRRPCLVRPLATPSLGNSRNHTEVQETEKGFNMLNFCELENHPRRNRKHDRASKTRASTDARRARRGGTPRPSRRAKSRVGPTSPPSVTGRASTPCEPPRPCAARRAPRLARRARPTSFLRPVWAAADGPATKLFPRCD